MGKKNKKLKGPNAKKKAAQMREKQDKLLGTLLVVAAILLGGYWAYTTALSGVFSEVLTNVKTKLAINNCNIEGAEGLDSVKIAEFLNFDKTPNIFNVSCKEIKNKISQIEGVAKVKVNNNPFSQTLNVKITKRTAKYRVSADNKLYSADKNGFLWQEKQNTDENLCLVSGVKTVEENGQKRIDKNDFERLEKTIDRISGNGKNSNNITIVRILENDITEFRAKNISVPVRLFGTLKYGSDDFEYFESVLRKKNKTPFEYFDAYENCVYSM